MREPVMGPAPVVLRVGVKGIDPVRREEHAAAGLDDTAELPHRRCRVGHVLQHLQAEHDVEARVLDRDRVDRPVQVGVRIARDVESDDLRGAVQQPLVGPVAATDVEHAQPAHVLDAEPGEQWLAHGVLHRGTPGIQPRIHSVGSLVAASPNVSQVNASSGMPAT